VKRRSGKYFVAGTALQQISLATGGTLTLKRSGKSRRTRQVDPRSVYFLAQIAPNAEFGIKNLKKNSGGDTPGPPVREKATPSSAVRGGRKLPHCWDLGLGNRCRKSKCTTTPLVVVHW